jgi:hypothetical protein
MTLLLRRPRGSGFQIRILSIDLCSRGADFLVQLPIFLLAVPRAVADRLAFGAGLEWLFWIYFGGTAVCAFGGGWWRG